MSTHLCVHMLTVVFHVFYPSFLYLLGSFQTTRRRKGDNYWVTSILALWEFNEVAINGLTTADVLRKINEPKLQE